MRLLVWFWSSGGGGSHFAVGLAARLAREADTEVTLSLRAEDPAIALAARRNLHVLRADVPAGRRRPWQAVMSLPRAAGLIRRHISESNADAVLIAMNFAAAAPLSFTIDRPLIYFAHDPRPHPGDYSPLLQRITQGILVSRADKVVALSDHGARQLGGGAVMPLASVYSTSASPRNPLTGSVRLLLFGRLLAYKGLDLLADALTGLDRADWRLTIAGAGQAASAALARLEALPQVSVRRGWLGDDEVDALFQSHDILIAPYVSATQSGVVAQAMASAMPVIATQVGALEEQLAGTGWLAAPNANALRAAITQGLDDVGSYAEHSAETLNIARAAAQADVFSWLHDLKKR